jgi:hypothetical protein
MVDGNDDKAVTYVYSETGFASLRIVMGVQSLMYMSKMYFSH